MRSSTLYCQLIDGVYWHFFPNPRGCLFCNGKVQPIAVEVREDHEAEKPYWGWWEEKKNAFLFVYPKKAAVEICFPYGTKVEEDRGRGKLLPVSIHEKSAEPPTSGG